MKLYLAPLEGITSYIYRKALYQCFDGFDKYFIPFIRAKQNLNFSGREKKDISPENNSGMYAVPQILTRNADDFLRTANQLKEYGYQEVNLNLGCPSKTVVTKGCGAGFLARPDELEQFLDRIYSKTDMTTGTVYAVLEPQFESENAKVQRLIVDNLAESNGETGYYQIPTVSFQDLTYGEYKVTIMVTTAAEGRSTYYLDGVRVYNPIQGLEEDQLVQDAYGADHELNAVFQ